MSDDDRKKWEQIKALANQQDANGNYVNAKLHEAYDSLDKDSRTFVIVDEKLGSSAAGQFTITKFNGPSDFSEAKVALDFRKIKDINKSTKGEFDSTFSKYDGLFGKNGFILRLAETFGHEANHGIFAINDPAVAAGLQQIMDNIDAEIAARPAKGRYPLPPDLIQRIAAKDQGLIPSERFAQQAEKIINGELKASQVKK